MYSQVWVESMHEIVDPIFFYNNYYNIPSINNFKVDVSPIPNMDENAMWNISGNCQKCSTLPFCTPTLGGQISNLRLVPPKLTEL